MVEGHSVHRVATRHRSKLVGKTFRASSPNARFAEGAALIDGKEFAGIEAVGKNLFAWFGSGADEVCVHVHFGMAGNWAVFAAADEPETTATTRLRLAGHGVVSHLSAMTVAHGTRDGLYAEKRRKLGEDPLRDDADPERLWGKVAASKKFDLIWHHTVELLKRGYATGSILTVDKEDERKYGQIRRYIYNKAKCPKCGSRVVSWDIAARTAYACETCQPKRAAEEAPATPAKKRRPADEAPKPAAKRAKKKAHVPFLSHCAPEAADSRKTVPELRAALKARGAATSGLKADLVARLAALPPMRAAEDAAADKARAGENMA
ncbi:hypothetical protein JL720_12694 [Aureococcus anophagefferens]|nr:hypothetical protein JL720_12694 [Aureococcus anophagefferens]